MKNALWRLTAIALFGLNSLAAWSAVRYVDINVVGGTGDGSSWPNASTDLRAIVDGSLSNDQIWVAQGTYVPTNGTDRSATFRMRNFTALYGGFTNGMTSLGERNWTNYATVLSGNLGDLATNTDNCSNVVIAASNTVVDGFTITAGFCTNNTSIANGAGMYVDANAPFAGKNVTIANCTFVSNIVSSTTIYSGRGGGLYLYGQNSNTVVTNCRFIGNSASYSGGGVYLGESTTTIKIIDCLFSGNQSADNGGGLGMIASSALEEAQVSNCMFLSNKIICATTGSGGAGLGSMYCYPAISDCVFIGNKVTGGETPGGGISVRYYINPSTLLPVSVNNCIISGNSAMRGGGISCYSAITVVSNSVLAGNYAGQHGGGFALMLAYVGAYAPSGTLVNCSVIGNYAGTSGGGLHVNGGTAGVVLKNCAIVGNLGASYGGGIACYPAARAWITNSILWGNSYYEWYSGSATSTIAYSDIAGGLAGITNVNSLVNDGGGNINADPLFAPVVTGKWTANGVFDPATFKTTLIDSNAAWTAGEHVGKTVVVNTNVYYYQYYIATNTATNITVWGSVQASGTNTASYRIVDIHEQSHNGRYTPIGWVTDSNHSPCIDAGNPNAAWANEPRPNGSRINMGRYGNTLEASMAYVPRGTFISFR